MPRSSEAVKFWKNSVPSGNWSTANSWSATAPSGADFTGVPGLNEPVRIYNTNAAAHTVTLDISPPALGLLVIDLPNPGVLTNTLSLTTNNTLTAAGIFIGGHNGSGVTTGRGTLTQSAGTITTSAGSDLYLASGAGSTGVYNLSGGALNANLSTVVGSLGTGTFNHSGGSHTLIAEAIGGALLVGYLGGGNGTYNLSGSGQLIANKNEIIGVDGVGQFFQTGGANTVSGSFVLHLGLNSGSQGTYNLSAGSLAVNNHQFIGYAGVGQFTQTGGTNTVANLIIADRATGQGAYAISGGTLTVGNNAVVGLLGTASMNITGMGSVNIAGDLAINNSSNVSLNGGTLRFNTISGLNRLIWQSGTLQLTGARQLNSDPTIGQLLGASPTIPSGKRLVVEGATQLSSLSNATATVNGGALTSLGQLIVGTVENQSGTLNLIGGATVTSTGAILGRDGGSLFSDPPTMSAHGTVNVNGATWNTGTFTHGNGKGTLNILNGGSVVSSNVDGVVIPSLQGNIDVLITGNGSQWISNGDVGATSPGAFNLTATVQDRGRLYVGNILNARVNLNGGTVRFNTLVDFSTFTYDAGTIQLAGNRVVGVDATIGNFYSAAPVIPIGKGLTVEGAATLTKPLKIDGGTFKANGLSIGSGGSLHFQSGVLEISGGTITGLAQLNIPTNGEFRAVGTQTVRIAGAVGSTITPTGLLILGDFNAVNGFYTNGTVNVGANTLALTDANDAVFDSAALVTLGNGASPGQLDALNGLTLNFGGNITGYGEVFTSNAIFTPLINNGHIIGASPTQRITLPGYVKGVGTFDNVNFTGTFAPGLSPTSLIVGNVGFSNSSLLVMEIGGTSPGSSYDQLISSGALTLDGALQIALTSGFNPAAGQSFNLLDWATVSGTFDNLLLPTLGGGLSWNTSQLYTTGVLSVVSAGLPGDYNNNGTVDAADYTLYRDALGTSTTLPNDTTPGSVTAADYAVWQANFSGSAASSAAIPEPQTLAILVSLLCLFNSPSFSGSWATRSGW